MKSHILRSQFIVALVLPLIFSSRLAGEPVANPDEYDTLEDDVLVVGAEFGLLFNDVSDGGQIAAVEESSPAHGTLELNSDGSFIYIPDDPP